jgi:hypothetical protein
MASPSPRTTFVSRGRLSGVIREQLPQDLPSGAPRALKAPSRQERDRRAFDEALYYRARLILGDSISRPLR